MLGKMAGPTGFEPATSRLTIWRPNQAERRPLVTLLIAEDMLDKTICSGLSRLEFALRVFYFRLRLPGLTFTLVGGTGIEPVTSAL